MKSIILKPHEVRCLQDNGEVLVVRPCRDQFQGIKVVLGPSKDGYFDFVRDTAEEHGIVVKCPFGVVGERRFVREKWRVFTWHPNDVQIEYEDGSVGTLEDNDETADLCEKLFEESSEDCEKAGVSLNDDDEYDCEASDLPTRWRSAATMREEASRFTIETTRIECREVQSIGKGEPELAGHSPEFAFAPNFKGWDLNLWCWFVWVKRVEG